MSLRSSFSIRKTKARQHVSRSPLQLPAEELAREFGSQIHTIKTQIGNQKLTYVIAQGYWMADGTVSTTSTNSREMIKLEKVKQELEEDNQTLRLKLESLMEMLAEVTAEYDLRRTG